MPKINFDITNMGELTPYLESLNTVDEILENSALIYASPVSVKKKELENIIRFGDLALENLEPEYNKLKTLMDNCIISGVNVQESVQVYMVKMRKLLDKRMESARNIECQPLSEVALFSMERQLFPVDGDYQIQLTECTQYGSQTAVMESLAASEYYPYYSPLAMLETCRNYFASDLDTEESYQIFKESFFDKIASTLNYESNDPDYKDLPVLYALENLQITLEGDFCDDESKCNKIDEFFEELETSVKDIITKHYDKIKFELTDMGDGIGKPMITPSPVAEFNPFNSIYNMTPFPVGTRTVQRTMFDCLDAETDEELVESLNEFSRLLTVCEHYGEDILLEAGRNQGGALKKAKRTLARGGKQVAAAAKTIGDGIKASKDTSKRITDPMVRFIENTYDSISKSDIEDRKKIIMTRGLKGKLMRILKWIKDVGILGLAAGGSAMAGFSVGTVIAAIALVGYIIRNARLDEIARKDVIKTLEEELKITEEKIEDSKGDDNKQKKYELMRIQSKLEKELARAKLRLSY